MHLVKFVSVSPRSQPFGHNVQEVLLSPNLPTPHSVQEAEPMFLVILPSVQSVQVVAPDPDISPISQGVHTLLLIAPGTVLFFPGGHALHVADEAAPIAVE